MPPWGATDTEVASFSTKILQELRQAFAASESQPTDEQYDGRSLLGVVCSITPLTAAEVLYQFQLLLFLIEMGCGLYDLGADGQNHPLAILLARGPGERMREMVEFFSDCHESCGLVAQKLSMPESVKLLSVRHTKGCPIHTIQSALDSTPQSNALADSESTPSKYPAGNVHSVGQETLETPLQSGRHVGAQELHAEIQKRLQ
ncbi:hypothetical protein BJX68DRAFT_272172 [Aspergillus pseudodeflectus]|uniref:Uncharacterized protein n=1 Tax=Aspergillus pseudodeflectus TaxID=176178 RepID=A0ABR4JHS4_9EURO